MTRIIPIITLPKPTLGEPCNGCGLCCINEVCLLGRELGDTKVCRALIKQEAGTYACGLVIDPYRYLPEERTRSWRMIDEMKAGAGEAALKALHVDLLGAGQGCDSDDEYQNER